MSANVGGISHNVSNEPENSIQNAAPIENCSDYFSHFREFDTEVPALEQSSLHSQEEAYIHTVSGFPADFTHDELVQILSESPERMAVNERASEWTIQNSSSVTHNVVPEVLISQSLIEMSSDVFTPNVINDLVFAGDTQTVVTQSVNESYPVGNYSLSEAEVFSQLFSLQMDYACDEPHTE